MTQAVTKRKHLLAFPQLSGEEKQSVCNLDDFYCNNTLMISESDPDGGGYMTTTLYQYNDKVKQEQKQRDR